MLASSRISWSFLSSCSAVVPNSPTDTLYMVLVKTLTFLRSQNSIPVQRSMQKLSNSFGSESLADTRRAMEEEDHTASFAWNDIRKGCFARLRYFVVFHKRPDHILLVFWKNQTIIRMIIEFDLRQLPIIFINLLEPQRERERERENLRDNNFTPSFCRETEASNSRPGFIQILFGERQRLVEAASSLGRDLLL